jgi:transglutaminase-like putative cysteine protease
LVRKLLLFAALLPAALHAKSYGEFDIAAAAHWVERIPVQADFDVPPKLARYGIYDILSDHQVRVVREGGTIHYFRTVRKCLTKSGVQNASEISIDFDPSYQRLVLHEVIVIRGTQRLDALDPSSIRVIEKEDDSQEGIYDGRLTALLFLKDVRAGDVVDSSWSIEGANPILHGHYADQYDLRSDVPSHTIRHRLLWASNAPRPLFRSTVAPQPGREDLVWELHDAPAIDLEDTLPSWYEPWETIDVSDFASWKDVAGWAVSTFDPDDESLSAVHELAGRIRREHADDPVTAAIRFVQDDIRYLGLEIGRNSHEPRQPAEILEQRWGDCKEKALLLSLLLRELGLEADPALVNTKARHRLDDRLPSPFAFDHVVVRVTRGGKTYWIDPTIADQGGTLETIETPNDARALVVSEGTSALTKIETRHRGRTIVDEIYAARDAVSPTSLVVRTTYSGTDADAMRAELATMDADEIARQRLNHYAVDHPSITAVSPPHVDDDRTSNVIVVGEHYSIRDLWKRGEWTYSPRAIEPSLDKPKTVIRSMPLAFDYPIDIVQRATFRFPGGADVDAKALSRTTRAFQFRFTPAEQGRVVTLEYSLRSLRDSVPAAEVPRHLTALNEIDDEMACTVHPLFSGSNEMRVMGGWRAPKWMWGLAVGLAIAGIGLLRFWKLSAF